MINYVIISGLSAMILVSLTIILFLIRFGFMKYNIKEWIQPEIDEPESWNQIFRKSKKLEIKPLYMGRSVTEPGARPYLRPESYPADFDFSASESAPTMSFIINHVSQGDILIDAGINSSYTPENHSGDLPLVLKFYQKISKYHYENDLDENLASYIEKLDLKPEYLLITHLHPDHIAGLTELPDDIKTMFGKEENRFFYKMICGKYLKNKKNLNTINFKNGFSLKPFNKVIDIFGDNSILAISSRGHTADHICYFINDSESPSLIVGDLTVSKYYFDRGIESSVDSKKDGPGLLEKSLNEFKEFIKMYPQVKIYYSHQQPE